MVDTKKVLNEQTLKKIDTFVVRKRRDVVLMLYKYGELSQKKLAEAINSSPASLANILCKMFEFSDALIKCRSIGKQRVYSLTALGEEYAGIICEDKTIPISEAWKNEEKNLVQCGETCLSELQRVFIDEWEYIVDNILFLYFLRGSEGFINDWTGVDKVAEFLEILETAILKEFDNAQYELMEKIKNPILKKRIEEVLNDFVPFVFILRNLKDERKLYEFYDLAIASVNGEVLTDELQQMIVEQKYEKEYEELKMVFKRMMPRIKGWKRQEILDYLNRLIPQNKNLCYMLAKELWNKQSTFR